GTLLEIVPDGRADERMVTPPTTRPAQEEATRVQAAPPVRKLAKELGVDLQRMVGTGPEGRVTAADVRAAAGGGDDAGDRAGNAEIAEKGEKGEGPAETADVPVAGSERRVALRGIRRAMARNMAEAWRTV